MSIDWHGAEPIPRMRSSWDGLRDNVPDGCRSIPFSVPAKGRHRRPYLGVRHGPSDSRPGTWDATPREKEPRHHQAPYVARGMPAPTRNGADATVPRQGMGHRAGSVSPHGGPRRQTIPDEGASSVLEEEADDSRLRLLDVVT